MDEQLYQLALKVCEHFDVLNKAELSWPMDDLETERALNALFARWEQIRPPEAQNG